MASPAFPPPVTKLRPLAPVPHDGHNGSTLLPKTSSWQSSILHKSDEETYIKAFLKLVSHVVVLSRGEAYCIQRAHASKGYILAHAGQDDFSIIDYKGDIPSQFSIGGDGENWWNLNQTQTVSPVPSLITVTK